MAEQCRTLPEQVLKNQQDIKKLMEQGTIDAVDLLKLMTGDETVVVDLAESGQQVEIHLDQHFKESLATKANLVGKVNADTVYSNDEPMFSDALETMSSLQEFYQFFYDRRKEPSKTYLIQGQVGVQFDNVLSLLSFPSVIGEHKWALLCECFSSEAGGFFIRLSLTTDVHTILYTNIIGGWLTGQTIGKWKDAKKDAGGIKLYFHKIYLDMYGYSGIKIISTKNNKYADYEDIYNDILSCNIINIPAYYENGSQLSVFGYGTSSGSNKFISLYTGRANLYSDNPLENIAQYKITIPKVIPSTWYTITEL